MKDFQSVCRGQVWWVPEEETEAKKKVSNRNDSVQAKSRPWVVVSCEENNINSTTVNCVPVHTSGKDGYPMHVFFMMNGRPQNVLCEQIRTWNVCDLKEYRYTLTKDVMAKVDIALANQLELTLGIPSVEAITSLIEKIAKLKSMEIKRSYQKVTDEAILEIASRIEDCFKADSVETEGMAESLANKVDIPKASVSVVKAQEVKLFPPKEEKSVESKVEVPKRKHNSRKWDPERVQEFLKDCDSMGPTDVAKKYGLKDKKAVYSYKYYFRNSRGTEYDDDRGSEEVS